MPVKLFNFPHHLKKKKILVKQLDTIKCHNLDEIIQNNNRLTIENERLRKELELIMQNSKKEKEMIKKNYEDYISKSKEEIIIKETSFIKKKEPNLVKKTNYFPLHLKKINNSQDK